MAFAQDSLEHAISMVDELPTLAKNHPIRQTTFRTIQSAVEGNREQLR